MYSNGENVNSMFSPLSLKSKKLYVTHKDTIETKNNMPFTQ